MSLGVGNITTHQKKEQAGPPFAPGSAVNGVSLDALSRIVLGNAAGATDAILLDPREIPLSAFSLMFVDNVAGRSMGFASTAGLVPSGLSFSDSTIPIALLLGMNGTGQLTLRDAAANLEQFLYDPQGLVGGSIFTLSENGTGTGNATASILATTNKFTALYAEIPGAGFIVIQAANQDPAGVGAATQYLVANQPSVYYGLFGPAYPEAALQNGCGMDTDVGPNNFWMNFSNRSLNGAGYRWFHQIGVGAATQTMEFENPGRLGIRVSGPQGAIHLPAGLAAVSGSPIALTPGVAVQTVLEDDRVNYDGSLLYLSNGGVNYIIPKTLTEVATLDFPNTAAGTSSDLTIAVIGAADADPVVLGTPNAATAANGTFTAWVSAADTVTVRFTNTNLVAAIDPASADFRVSVLKY